MFHEKAVESSRRVVRSAAAVLLCLLALGLSSSGCAPAPAAPASDLGVDHRPPRPHPHARWVDGHWTYQQGRYHWVKGSWSR